MIYYYDSGTGGTEATSDNTSTAGTATVSSNNYTVVVTQTTTVTGTCTGNGPHFYAVPRSREIVVEHPSDWKNEQHEAFIKLVNEEAQSSGWRVTMLFRGGDLALVDPNIEVRKMKDFVPLLKDRASTVDRGRIDAFFMLNPP